MELFIRYVTVYLSHSVTLFLMSKRKYSMKTSVLAWAGIFILSAFLSLGSLFGKSENDYFMMVFVATMLLYAILYIIISEGCILKNIFIFATYVNVFIFVVLFSQYIADRLFGGSDYAMTAVRTVLYIIFIFFLVKFIRPTFYKATRNINRGWGALALLVVTFCVGLIFVGVILNVYVGDVRWRSLIIIILFFIMIAAYYVMNKTIIYLNEESDKRQLQMQQKLLRGELEAEKEFVDNAKRFRHDLRHHNRLMLEYLDRGDIEGAKSYLNSYDILFTSGSLDAYCENIAVNATLRLAARHCKTSGIDFSVDTVVPETLPMTQAETGILFSNLLENACEAAEKCENAFMKVRSVIRNDALHVETENSVSVKVKFEKDLPQTTKQEGGIGVLSMKTVLEKYSGMLLCRQENDIFITQIILPL